MLNYHDFLQAKSPYLFGIGTTILTSFRVGLFGNAQRRGRKNGLQKDTS